MLLLFASVIFIHVFLLINTKFTLWPEMVVYPYLINENFALYRDIINPYQPAFAYALSIFSKFFGYNPVAFRTLTTSIILIIDLLIYVTTFKITKSKTAALVSILFFSIFSIPFGVNELWYDLVQTPFILLSVYFFHKFLKEGNKKHLFFSFLIMTITFFIKQQAVWFLAWMTLILFLKEKKSIKTFIKDNYFIYLPFLIILLLHILFFSTKGLLGNYIYWTFTFPFLKASSLPGYVLFPAKRQILSVLILVSLFSFSLLKEKTKYAFIFGSSVVLLMFAYPRFDYFHLIPSFAVLSLLAYSSFKNILGSKPLLIIGLLIFLALSIFGFRYYLKNWTKEIRFFDKDIYQAALYISLLTNKGEAIFIQNGPDQLYPLTHTVPSKPWATQFPWYLELEGVQESLVSGLVSQKPRYIFYKKYDEGKKYNIGSYRPDIFASYIDLNYIDIIPASYNLFLRQKHEN